MYLYIYVIHQYNIVVELTNVALLIVRQYTVREYHRDVITTVEYISINSLLRNSDTRESVDDQNQRGVAYSSGVYVYVYVCERPFHARLYTVIIEGSR